MGRWDPTWSCATLRTKSAAAVASTLGIETASNYQRKALAWPMMAVGRMPTCSPAKDRKTVWLGSVKARWVCWASLDVVGLRANTRY